MIANLNLDWNWVEITHSTGIGFLTIGTVVLVLYLFAVEYSQADNSNASENAGHDFNQILALISISIFFIFMSEILAPNAKESKNLLLHLLNISTLDNTELKKFNFSTLNLLMITFSLTSFFHFSSNAIDSSIERYASFIQNNSPSIRIKSAIQFFKSPWTWIRIFLSGLILILLFFGMQTCSQ